MEESIRSLANQEPCRKFPNLPLESPEMMKFLKDEEPVECGDENNDWVSCDVRILSDLYNHIDFMFHPSSSRSVASRKQSSPKRARSNVILPILLEMITTFDINVEKQPKVVKTMCLRIQILLMLNVTRKMATREFESYLKNL